MSSPTPTPNSSPFLQGALVGALLLGIGYAVGWNAARSTRGETAPRDPVSDSAAQPPVGVTVPFAALRTPPAETLGPPHREASAERLDLPVARRPDSSATREPGDALGREAEEVAEGAGDDPVHSVPEPPAVVELREALEASRRREAHLLDRALAAEMAARSYERAVAKPTDVGNHAARPGTQLAGDVAAAAAREAARILGGVGEPPLPASPSSPGDGGGAESPPRELEAVDLGALREFLLALGPWPFSGRWTAFPREAPAPAEPASATSRPRRSAEELEGFRRRFQDLLRSEGYTELELTRLEDVDALGLHEPLFRVVDARGALRSLIRARRARFHGHARLRTITMELLDGYEQPVGSEPESFYRGRRAITWADVRYPEWIELLAPAGGVLEEAEEVRLDAAWRAAAVADDLNLVLDRTRGERAWRLRRLQGVSTQGELVGVELHQYQDRGRTQLEVIHEAGRARVTWNEARERLEFELLEGFQRRGTQRIPFFEGRCRVYVPIAAESLGEAWDRIPRPSAEAARPGGPDESLAPDREAR